MTRARPLPGWFAALLAGDALLALLVAVMLAGPSRPAAAVDAATVRALGLATVPVGAAAAIVARALWRRGAETAATALALLPLVLGVPFVFATLGLPF